MNKNILSFLKQSNFELPLWLGFSFAKIPFKNRPGIGRLYEKQYVSIDAFKNNIVENKKQYIYNNFFKVFEHAYLNVPFYTELYKNAGITVKDINGFDRIKDVPIVTKKDLIDIPLKDRSYPVKGSLLVNTGGSSGKPFSFYMDPLRFGNEWAHIHYMWSKFQYTPQKLKLSFDGRSTVKDQIQYDFIRHSLRFDIYADKSKACEKLLAICKKHKIEYLHGYPSAISEFATHCSLYEPELLKILRSTLKGAFLSSEFPSPHYRNTIEEVFNIPTQSFYGHTETCVMALEGEKFKYHPFQTYGYAEGIDLGQGTTDLIGTSYFNFASPLIRYNTEDSIEVLENNSGILSAFSINEGRKGEFLLDKNNMKIPLTGLLFGRHHKLFDVSDHIQISQTRIGEAKVLYVSNKQLANIDSFFDSRNVNITFSFERISEPILTKAGKLSLLVNRLY